MAFHFDPELLKKHPYAVGAIVIVGGVVVFAFLSRSQSSAATVQTGSNSGDFQAELQASEQEQALNAQSNLQSQQTAAQLQVAQLQADVSNQQTAAQLAAVENSNQYNFAADLVSTQANVAANATTLAAQTTQQANELTYAQNIQSMQDAVLTDNINAGVQENADNNATQLAAVNSSYEYQNNIANLQAGIASQSLNDSTLLGSEQLNDEYQLASTENSQYDNEVQYIEQHAGTPQNSALDANDQTGLFATILSHGNPSVAQSSVQSSAASAVAGDTETASNIASVTKLGSSIITGLFAA